MYIINELDKDFRRKNTSNQQKANICSYHARRLS